jgi:hypothetical protein
MKKQILTLALIAFTAISFTANAKPKLNPNRHWVMEYTKKQQNVKIVKFYDDNEHLIGTHTFYENLDANCKKVQRKLNYVLNILIEGIEATRKHNLMLQALNKQVSQQ